MSKYKKQDDNISTDIAADVDPTKSSGDVPSVSTSRKMTPSTTMGPNRNYGQAAVADGRVLTNIQVYQPFPRQQNNSGQKGL
ncbi:MAG: hypothetical protein V4694_05685 [Pseudomonadota bacterium]